MGDEAALEARLERAHTVIGDLLRSLGDIELLPERQQAAAMEAIAFREMHVIERGVLRMAGKLDDPVDWKVEYNRLTAELTQSEERRKRAETAALTAEQHNEKMHELVASALDYSGWERAGWKDLVAAVEREHHALVQARAALPPGDEQVPVAERVAQLVREHGEMVAEMMKGADPEDVASAAATLADSNPAPTTDHRSAHSFQLTPTGETAFHSSRPRYRVECETCNVIVHPGTTSPEAQQRYHEKHPEDAARRSPVSDVYAFRALASDADETSTRDRIEFIDVVCDWPPGPTSGRFVEVEDHRGHSMKVGEWLDRGDGMWALRIPMQSPAAEVGEVMAAAGALSALTAVVATSGMNWQRSPCLAWVYGVLVGHERDVLEDLQMVFGWPDGTVDEIDRHRRALIAARGA